MASPFFFVKKKDGKLRLVQDYQKLNEMTVKNCYPLPLILELIDKLTHAKIFSKMDIQWDIIIFRSRRETNGRRCSELIEDYLNR